MIIKMGAFFPVPRCKGCGKPLKCPKINKSGYCSNCRRDNLTPKQKRKRYEIHKRWIKNNLEWSRKYQREYRRNNKELK